jgi:hypothetical protein
MIERIIKSPPPKASKLHVQRIDEVEDALSEEAESSGREPGEDRNCPEQGRLDVVSISEEARTRDPSRGSARTGDYSKGVFDRARKSGVHVMPPRKHSASSSVEAMRRALRSVPPETREMLKIVGSD